MGAKENTARKTLNPIVAGRRHREEHEIYGILLDDLT